MIKETPWRPKLLKRLAVDNLLDIPISIVLKHELSM